MRYFCPSAIFGYLGGQPGDKMGDKTDTLLLPLL